MFLKSLLKLTYIRKCKYGKYKIIKKINKKIFSVVFKKTNTIKVLKKVSDSENALYCYYKKGFKKTNKSKYGSKGVQFKEIKNLFYKDIELKGKIYPFFWSIMPKSSTNVEIMYCGSFINEVCTNEILKTFVKYYTDFFCGYDTAWKSKRQGNIILEYGGKPLENVIEYLNLEDLKTIVFQVLVALCWGQKQVHFKHHDLHTENVFIQLLESPLVFNAKTKYEIPVCEKDFSHPFALEKKSVITTVDFLVPKRYHIRLADFGFSCTTNPRTQRRNTRADYDLLETGTRKWGEFSEVLYKNEGYDMIYFIASLKDEVTSKNRPWLKSVLNKINELNGSKVRVSSYCRPLDRCTVSPYDLLMSDIFEEFRVSPLRASLSQMD